MTGSQLFSPSADIWLRLALVAVVVAVIALLVFGGGWFRSDWLTEETLAPDQPVPFSHEHHVGQLGLDCRLCHTSVETEATAGFPPTATCMTCHSQLFTGAPMLGPVRESLAGGDPIRWRRVHDLPDFVYFEHAPHIRAGVGCETCHGRVDRMPLTRQAQPLSMGWCLDCHRDPAPRLRPPEAVFTMGWHPPVDRRPAGERQMAHQGTDPAGLTDCFTCHR